METVSNDCTTRRGNDVIAFCHSGVAAIVEPAVRILRERGYRVAMLPDVEALATQGPDRDGVGVLLVSSKTSVNADLLSRFPNLAGVVFAAIGTESIDLADAAARNLIVAHGATSENWDSMAEATVLLMLTLLYRARQAENALAADIPREQIPPALMLKGKTIGLVGFGRIARGVASRLAAWGVRFLITSPRATPDTMPQNAELCGLDDLLRGSDIVSLHAGLNRDNRGMIGRPQFALMKPSAYLVNTARGGLVDETALIKALDDKSIAGAALDTFQVEPLPLDSPLRGRANVLLTPHILGHTAEALDSLVSAAVENVVHVLDGREPLYVRNPQQLEAWLGRWSPSPQGEMVRLAGPS